MLRFDLVANRQMLNTTLAQLFKLIGSAELVDKFGHVLRVEMETFEVLENSYLEEMVFGLVLGLH